MEAISATELRGQVLIKRVEKNKGKMWPYLSSGRCRTAVVDLSLSVVLSSSDGRCSCVWGQHIAGFLDESSRRGLRWWFEWSWGEQAGRIRDQDWEGEAPAPLDGAVWAEWNKRGKRILIGAQLQVYCVDVDIFCGRRYGGRGAWRGGVISQQPEALVSGSHQGWFDVSEMLVGWYKTVPNPQILNSYF